MILKKDIRKGSKIFILALDHEIKTRKLIHVSFHTLAILHELEKYLIFRTVQPKRVTRKNVEHIQNFRFQKSV